MAIQQFATLAGGNEPLSLFDTAFAQVAALGAIPCTATGTNALALTPNANTPTVSGYPDLQPSFVFAATQTSTGAVTANVAGVGTRNVYKWNGAVQCGSGDILAGSVYRLTPLLALNGGLGGFVCDTIGFNATFLTVDFLIDGGGVAITTGPKGSIGPLTFAGVIQNWTLLADQPGSVTVDILRANNAVPSASIIGGGTKPTLSSAQYNGLQAPAGWTSITLAASDMLTFSIATAATITKLTVGLQVSKS